MPLSTTWYHGTFFPEIQEFRPFSHFGTELAAVHAIDHIRQKKYWQKSRIDFIPTIYEIEIFCDDVNVLEVNDWHTPKSAGLAIGLRDHFYSKEDSESRVIGDKFRDINRKILGTENYNNGFDDIKSALSELGVKVLVYSNEHEGNKMEKSICVIDSSIINFNVINKYKVTKKIREKILTESFGSKPHLQFSSSNYIPYEYDDD